ncbi:MAG: glycosyltransferase family 9 protein [Bacteroidetes bacterium]|nr:glycosyltransferase family 9 protein [Bacteroidota bacterium]
MKKILVIQTAFLGDVILATAIIEQLHLCFPKAKLFMLVREGNESLLKNHPLLTETMVWKKNSGKFTSLINSINKVRSHHFDLVVNLQRFFSSGLITVLSGATIKTGFNKNPLSFLFTHKVPHVIGDGRHETARNAALIEKWCTGKSIKPKLYPSTTDFEKTETLKKSPYYVMAPASVWFTKQLPQSKWVELLNKTPAGSNTFLVGAPSDFNLCKNIIDASGNANATNLAGKLSLLQTAALMKDANMNYVNDSGPLHIASAMDAPVTSFFCSTVPEFGFGPLSTQSIIVQTPEQLDCRPCGLHGFNKCPKGHFSCATTIITPEILSP